MKEKINDKYLSETLSFWNDLNKMQKKWVKESLAERHFVVGETMRTSSENCLGLFLLMSGQVRAYIISETGKEITLYRLFERDVCIFTASCIVKNISFDVFMEVEKDTEALLLPIDIYRKLSQESVAVQTFTNEIIGSRFTDIMWIMEQALFTSLDKRLAMFLLEESNISGSDTIVITHDKIANHLGSAREVISRLLKYLQDEGMVSLGRGKIEIIDRNKLSELAT